ncbi:MAG: hypothetical protein PWQ12_1614 [Clostridiales bacterium]|jgi:NTE family protein|nr:hypothetical protein [Clostridiales bacterium]
MRGIALEGGGAKGAYQVGALKALGELGIEYDVIAGSSIGAVNASILCSDGIETLESIWRDTQASDIIEGDKEILDQLLKMDFKGDNAKLRQFLIETVMQGGFDVSPYRKLLRRVVDEGKVRRSKMRYGLVTLSLTDLKPVELFIEDIPEGKLLDYVFASSNFPAFKDERFDNKHMIDGGFFDNLPINMLLGAGCDSVIAIRLFGVGRIRKVKASDKTRVTYIEPSEPLGGTLEIDPERARRNIQMGYYDTMRLMTKLEGRKYYLNRVPSEEEALSKFAECSNIPILPLMALFGSDQTAKRFLFETIIPVLAELLALDRNFTYSNVYVAAIEWLAEELGIDRFETRSFEALIEQVNKRMASDPKYEKKTIDELDRKLILLIPNKGVKLLPERVKKPLIQQIILALYEAGLSK